MQGAGRLGQAHDQRKAPTAFDHLSDLFALNQALQRGQNLRRRHAVLRCCRIVDADLDLRCQHLLFDFQIGDAGDSGQPAAQGIGLTAQGVEVVAKDLDGDLRTHARQHVVDTVRDGLADGNRCREVDQAGTNIGRNLVH